MSSLITRLCLFFIVSLVSNLAQAAPILYVANLNGSSESPPNASPGTGIGYITFDSETHTLLLDISFSGLLGNTTAAHLHCCTVSPEAGNAGVATTTPTFPGFPTGVTSGTYNQLVDLTQSSSWNTSFISDNGGTIAGAEAAFAASLEQGRVYLNIHTSVFAGGEIRGFLHEASVPEPATLALLGFGLIGLGSRRHPVIKPAPK